MVQGKYIITFISNRLVFLVIIFYFTASQGSSWLPEEGRYKFSSNVLFIDRATRDAQKERAQALSNIHKDINFLLNKRNPRRKQRGILEES